MYTLEQLKDLVERGIELYYYDELDEEYFNVDKLFKGTKNSDVRIVPNEDATANVDLLTKTVSYGEVYQLRFTDITGEDYSLCILAHDKSSAVHTSITRGCRQSVYKKTVEFLAGVVAKCDEDSLFAKVKDDEYYKKYVEQKTVLCKDYKDFLNHLLNYLETEHNIVLRICVF